MLLAAILWQTSHAHRSWDNDSQRCTTSGRAGGYRRQLNSYSRPHRKPHYSPGRPPAAPNRAQPNGHERGRRAVFIGSGASRSLTATHGCPDLGDPLDRTVLLNNDVAPGPQTAQVIVFSGPVGPTARSDTGARYGEELVGGNRDESSNVETDDGKRRAKDIHRLDRCALQ